MQILLINNDGGGFADYIDIEEGTTVSKLVEQRIAGKPSNYLIRVNRQPCAPDQVLQHGDRVSITPVKIEGFPGVYIVLDKMHKRWEKRIDIYMGHDLEAARAWGKRQVEISW